MGATIDLDGVRLLRRRTWRQPPGEAGTTDAEPEEGRVEMLDPEMSGRVRDGDVSALMRRAAWGGSG